LFLIRIRFATHIVSLALFSTTETASPFALDLIAPVPIILHWRFDKIKKIVFTGATPSF